MIDFKKPQHQSVKGIVIMFADTVQSIVRAAWAPLIFLFIKTDESKYWLVLLVSLFVLLLAIGFSYLQFRRFTFFLDDKNQEFVLQKGVFSTEKLVIQLSKIQQVNINQSLIQKLINVYSVDIDTAGSSKKEASIRAVDKTVALLLKERLIINDAPVNRVPLTETSEHEIKPFLKLSFTTLLKVGLTSNYGRSIALLLGFFAAAYNGIKDISYVIEIDEYQVDSYFEKGMGMLYLSVIIAVLFIALIGINVVRTIVKYFDFQITKRDHALTIMSGLFAKKNTLLNPVKVQVTTYSQNFFQKKLRFLDMKMKQITAVNEHNNKKSDIDIPGCNPVEYKDILELIYEKLPKAEKTLLPNLRYVLFPIIFKIIIPVAGVVIYGLWNDNGFLFYIPFIIIYVTIISLFIGFGYKNYQLHYSNEFIIKKSGAWDVTHHIIEPNKIQGITTKQYFWHKLSNIGHLTLHTAAGDISFHFGNYDQINQLVNIWLYQIESSNKAWS